MRTIHWMARGSHVPGSEGSPLEKRGTRGQGRRPYWVWGVLAVCCIGFGAIATSAVADCNVAPGTVITHANWQQYKDCFSDGVQILWSGSEFWKMPDDVEIHVGAQHQWSLPKPYIEATEKYGGQTQLDKQPTDSTNSKTTSQVRLFRIRADQTRAPRSWPT